MKRKKIWLIWLLALLPLVAAAVVYQRLPAEIPLHWGINGEVDNTGARWIILPLASIGLLCTALFFVTRYIDPKRKNYARFTGAYEMYLAVFNLFMLAITLATLVEALYPGTCDMKMVVIIGIGLLFTVIGNLMPKFKHNYFLGIRTPWTLADETVWYRTHRLGGVLWFIGGIVMIFGAFLPNVWSFAVVLCDVFVIALIPTVMSYVWFRRQNVEK